MGDLFDGMGSLLWRHVLNVHIKNRPVILRVCDFFEISRFFAV